MKKLIYLEPLKKALNFTRSEFHILKPKSCIKKNWQTLKSIKCALLKKVIIYKCKVSSFVYFKIKKKVDIHFYYYICTVNSLEVLTKSSQGSGSGICGLKRSLIQRFLICISAS
jgi:hypothetical protein